MVTPRTLPIEQCLKWRYKIGDSSEAAERSIQCPVISAETEVNGSVGTVHQGPARGEEEG